MQLWAKTQNEKTLALLADTKMQPSNKFALSTLYSVITPQRAALEKNKS
jgi:hypothetical protein